ncbi:hypothetical protein AGMMS49991_10280 [Spirochaetia bacterium]|nr:hypothetical protein AGMMS49991_10280 [Spirochaetia bacterium]
MPSGDEVWENCLILGAHGDDEISICGIRSYDKGDDMSDVRFLGTAGVMHKPVAYEGTWM